VQGLTSRRTAIIVLTALAIAAALLYLYMYVDRGATESAH
jgi:hypothetical protein